MQLFDKIFCLFVCLFVEDPQSEMWVTISWYYRRSINPVRINRRMCFKIAASVLLWLLNDFIPKYKHRNWYDNEVKGALYHIKTSVVVVKHLHQDGTSNISSWINTVSLIKSFFAKRLAEVAKFHD
jgi:hypothetical protein